ncbi:MAG: hypothetical protein KDA95_11670 [Acidimicrobiales bacterium]|nr:hypothetical protein [Acidimicrobiales bacterium]
MSDPTMPNDPQGQPTWESQPPGWAPPPVDNPYGQPSSPYGYPPNPYGAPQGGYGYPIEHPQGTTVLVLGVLSLVVCGVLGPFAWSMGNKTLKEIDVSPGAYSNRGSVQAGRICGMIATVILGLGVLVFVLFFLAAILGSASSSS